MKKVFFVFILFCFVLISCSAQRESNIYSIHELSHAELFEDSGTAYSALNFEFVDTPESTCFSLIGYDYVGEYLVVQFKDSGAVYVYKDVPEAVWDALYAADSRGGFYNRAIKGIYQSEKIER